MERPAVPKYEVEHIAAVQDNPFVRNFGNENVLLHRQESKDLGNNNEKTEDGQGSSGDTDQEQEYHVNSGFVNKLRSKFAELENKRNRESVTLSRKSASVENLLNLNSHGQYSSREKVRHGSASRSSADDSKILSSSEISSVELRKKQAPTSYRSSYERPKSKELKTKVDKPPIIKPPILSPPNHLIKSVKPLVARRSSTESLKKQQRNSASSPTKIEHHDWKIAPDLEKIDTDNIVIIETTQPTLPSPREVNLQQAGESSKFKRVRPFKDKSNEDIQRENELPKPNTVSTFLSMFEKGTKPVRPTQAWKKSLSPTRKGSDSDANSPRISSPNVTPRSPLTKKFDDNVFTDAQGKIETSDENICFKDPKDISCVTSKSSSSVDVYKCNDSNHPRALQNDTKADSNFFHNANKPILERIKLTNKDTNGDSAVIEQVPSPREQSGEVPVSPLHLVFDSHSVAPLKRPVKLKPEKGHKVPKDTLALKHEKDQLKIKSPDQERTVFVNKEMKKTDFIEKNALSNESNKNVLLESNIKPSQRKAKISPRKTKVFDSSNMVKANREPPKIPSRNLNQESKENKAIEKPKEVSIEIKDKETKKERSISKPPRVSQNLKKETKHAFDKITNTTVSEVQNTPKNYDFPKDTFNDTVKSVSEEEQTTEKEVESKTEKPVPGVPSFLAKRLKKSQEQNGEQQLKTSAVHLVNGSSPSPVPRKRPAPEIPTNLVSNNVEKDETNDKVTPPPLPSTPEPALPKTIPKTNIDDIMKRRNKSAKSMPKMVFDSSKIANKRKDPPKRKPPRKTLEEINKIQTNGVVPKLDLTSITNDNNDTDYQEGYIPTVIQPCPFKFIHAEVILERSPYKKTKKQKDKLKIQFDDHATTTFEYAGEEEALEEYLKEHPNEREEALQQEHEMNSDGIATEMNDEPNKDSPRLSESDSLRSNTVIGQPTGALTNYKSKMQIDFQFGVPTESDDDVVYEPEPEQEVDPDSLQLLPADDNELDTFSAEVSKADMLF